MPTRVMVSGALAAHPLGGGGNTWAFLQYVLGFRALGCRTVYVEHLDPHQCIDDRWHPAAFRDSANARLFRDVIRRFGIEDSAALLQRDGDEHVGLSHRDVALLARDTDLFVNLSGRFHLDAILRAARRRMYVDLDPGFVQIWQAQYGVDMNLTGHEVHVTVGLNLGAADCPLPTCGIRWQTTLPPVVLEHWVASGPPGSAYTTVADWRGYSPVEWNGRWYGQKAEEFLRIAALPERVDPLLEICLAVHPDEPGRAEMERHGWHLASPATHAATTDDYRDYIWRSRGEVSVAKHGYVAGRTGWFSDRSACYLAAGRPVVVQDTGIGRYVPTGCGLLTFEGIDAAATAITAVEADYAAHAAAAGEWARNHLDARLVLGRLLVLSGL